MYLACTSHAPGFGVALDVFAFGILHSAFWLPLGAGFLCHPQLAIHAYVVSVSPFLVGGHL
jgi:hypothetical protein